MRHELTNKISPGVKIMCTEAVDEIITSYMKERAEWLKKQYNWGIHPGEAELLVSRELLHKDIDQAFGLTKKTLEEKFNHWICPAGIPMSYNVEDLDKRFLARSKDLAEIARQHFKENPGELE